jgi:rubrerythrin
MIILIIIFLAIILAMVAETWNAPEGWICPRCGSEVIGEDKCAYCGENKP